MSAKTSSTKTDPQIAIIGAGVGGLAFAIALKRQWGFKDFIIFERTDDIGGTWRENTYPGCGSDIAIHWYSLSTDLKPDWTRAYAGQPEIQSYWQDLTSKYDLRPSIRFNTNVNSATWNVDEKLWEINTEDRKTGVKTHIRTKILVSAIGILAEPNTPKFGGVGLEGFKGVSFHSARWDHNLVLSGKRVAVIGNGCSATQFVPIISADPTVNVVHFCRTPMWYIPLPQTIYSSFTIWLFRYVPFVARLYRLYTAVKEDTRFIAFRGEKSFLSRVLARTLRSYITNRAPAEYVDKLIPKYPPGCRRLIPGTDYLGALHRPNLTQNWDKIEGIAEDGIVTSQGRLPFDVIITATGFVTDKYPVHIRGRTGQTVEEFYDSQGGPTAYLGTTLPGFPNFITVSGPNTVTGHASVIFTDEVQINYALKLLKPVTSSLLTSVEPTVAALNKYNDWISRRLRNSVWTQCVSWYRAGSQGKIFSTFPGPVVLLWWFMRKVNWADFEVIPVEGKAQTWERSKKMGRSVTMLTVLGVLLVGGLVWGRQNGLEVNVPVTFDKYWAAARALIV